MNLFYKIIYSSGTIILCIIIKNKKIKKYIDQIFFDLFILVYIKVHIIYTVLDTEYCRLYSYKICAVYDKKHGVR
jgi:hypothetical protein